MLKFFSGTVFVLTLLVPLPAAAQSTLPSICTADFEAGHNPSAPSMGMMGDEAHAALSAGMDQMHADMAVGMTAEDIDIAFVCGMIPHHQGAIDMARAELAHGDDPWARELAEKVIAAQEQEIADMIAWLEAR
jgi:uncharacterized protein (DUF305 family)